jgi:hypothetical protein
MHEKILPSPSLAVFLPPSWTTSLHGCVYPFARGPGSVNPPAHYFLTMVPSPPPHVALWSWFLPLTRLECTAWLRDFHSLFHRIGLLSMHSHAATASLAASSITQIFTVTLGCCQTFLVFARIAKYKNVSLSQKGRRANSYLVQLKRAF